MIAKMPVMELFGPTIQGEGPDTGRKTLFLRTAGCDYSCSWCDTPYTWDGSAKERIRMMDAEEIINEFVSLDPSFDYLVISGGNPALIGEAMQELIDRLHHSRKVTIGIETQGSVWQDWLLAADQVILSPKPPSSGMDTDAERLDQIISRLTDTQATRCKVSLKIVVFDDADYEFARSLHQRYPLLPFYLSVGNTNTSEEGPIAGRVLTDYFRLAERVILDAAMQTVHVLPQMHTLLWGNRKGV